MKTTFRIKQPYAEKFMKIADAYEVKSPVRPERFIEIMKRNTGMAGAMFGNLDEEGLEFRNPVICVLGDSVTAGHFESLMPSDPAKVGEYFQALMTGDMSAPIIDEYRFPSPNTNPAGRGYFPVEIYDAGESYVEKFKNMLIDEYEFTSPSVINAGIAGDVLTMMEKRLTRDVICHQPDLVIINGSLNWMPELGTTADYKEILRRMIRRVKTETKADLILLTPNGDLPNTLFTAPGQGAPVPTTPERADAIRQLAEEEQVCLADVRAVWDQAAEAGIPWKELLANGINHPSAEGHEVYAKILMKLCR